MAASIELAFRESNALDLPLAPCSGSEVPESCVLRNIAMGLA
jgi:hypothetical protein